MRYKDEGELHLDFHGAANTTIRYITETFGTEALTSIFDKVGKEVYKSIHEGLKQDNPAELIEHLDYYFSREGGEYSLETAGDCIKLTVRKCPAVAHLQKLGLEIAPDFCRQTIDVNNALCDGTPWQCETVVEQPGVCRQTFTRRENKPN